MDESCKHMLTKRCIQEVYTTRFYLFRVQKQVEQIFALKSQERGCGLRSGYGWRWPGVLIMFLDLNKK